MTQNRLLWAEVIIKGRKKGVWNRFGIGEKRKLKLGSLNSAREVCGETTGRLQRDR